MASNADYSRASRGPKNVKSQPSSRQVSATIKTSMGKTGRMSVARRNSPVFSTSGPRPSWEGLDSGKSAWIQPNGAGYSGAKRASKSMPRLGRAASAPMDSIRFARHGIINHTPTKTATGAVGKLNKLCKLNRMF